MQQYAQEKLQRSSLEDCKHILAEFMKAPSVGSFVQAIRNSQEYEHAFRYKGRLVDRAPMLHIAIWLESSDPHYTGIVQLLIDHKADMEAGRAEYQAGQFTISLHPLIIAAGMGNVDALKALTADTEPDDLKGLLNRRDLSLSDGAYFYTPLHDACFLGRTNAAMWLLENGSLVMAQDKLNMTPLHLFVVAGNYDDTDRVEAVVKEFVKQGADLSMRVNLQGPFQRRWGEKSYNPLELATQHDANFPRHSMRLLAPSFECFQSFQSGHSGTALEAEVAEGRTSFLADLLMLASKSPQAASELSESILHLSQDPSTRRAINLQLRRDVQAPNAMELLVKLLNSSPPSATNILSAVTQHPLVPDPLHHPIRSRTNLWGPIVNITMRCSYKPDSCLFEGTLAPSWFHHAITAWYPQWHDQFAPHVDDISHRSSAYDVQVFVVPVKNLLCLDVIQALAAIDTESHGTIFATKPIQGIVTCMWQTLGEKVHYSQMVLSFIDLFTLIAWGLTTGDNPPFSRLWIASDDIHLDTKLDSPTVSPFCTLWLMGTFIKEGIALLYWFFTFLSRRSMGFRLRALARCCRRAPEQGKDSTRGWDLTWFLFSSGFSFQAGVWALLGVLLLFVVKDSDDYLDSFTQGLLALNVFMRTCRLLLQISKSRAMGPRILSILGSLMSGTMQEMIVVGVLIFAAFGAVFLVLRREHSPGWVALYLYRGLLFGDGDGLDRFGVAAEQDAIDAEGDPLQHDWSTFYGVTSTMVFGLAILNLIIAIYSDEYKAQQIKAPMVFIQKRAAFCSETIIKYVLLGRRFRMSVQARWCTVCLLVFVIAVLTGIDETMDQESLPPGWKTVMRILPVLVGFTQLAFMIAQAHVHHVCPEKEIQGRQTPKRCFHELRRWFNSFGELHVVSAEEKPSAHHSHRKPYLEVQDAFLWSNNVLKVTIEAGWPKSAKLVPEEAWFKEACENAVLSWQTELRQDFLTPSDVENVKCLSAGRMGEDPHYKFTADIMFEPLVDLWRPFKLTLGDGNTRTEVSAVVRLPHFLWMCCVEDFDNVQGLERVSEQATQLKEIQEELKAFEKRLPPARGEEEPVQQKVAADGVRQADGGLSRAPTAEPAEVSQHKDRAAFRRLLSRSYSSKQLPPQPLISTLRARSSASADESTASAGVARPVDAETKAVLSEVKDLCEQTRAACGAIKEEVELKSEERNTQFEELKKDLGVIKESHSQELELMTKTQSEELTAIKENQEHLKESQGQQAELVRQLFARVAGLASKAEPAPSASASLPTPSLSRGNASVEATLEADADPAPAAVAAAPAAAAEADEAESVDPVEGTSSGKKNKKKKKKASDV